ncbi:MAG: hypothetical protein Q8M07_21120, partial [Prosthecobacter sp.]|nr:hypothetical protein [Prosthecobacter sp.]
MSPLLERRQSDLHLPGVANTEEEECRRLAYAYAFYDLTFTAMRGPLQDPAGRDWFSPTQRILEKKKTAARRWSLPLCYLQNKPNDGEEYWHIPPSIQQEIVKAVSLEPLLDSIVLKNGSKPRTLDELKELLCKCLANPRDFKTSNLNFAEQCLDQISRHLRSPMNNEARQYIASTNTLVREMFGEPEISVEETFYMVLTHVMWSRACPGTNYAYTFPVLLPGYPCVLTMGTDEVLRPETVSALVVLATSMFTAPVMVDYAEHVVREKRQLQRRTARAAIMSRNLSHNIGSHALANARFSEAIGVLHLQSTPPSATEEAEEQDLNATDRTHNGNFCVTKGEIWRAQSRLTSLNNFLQMRLDFIARALGETTSSPEPMFFVNELLKGFLGQTVLLNTLLSDIGFTAENIEYHIDLPGCGTPIIFKQQNGHQPLRHEVLLMHADSFDDILIAVPGGMVGCHAFYAFLENLMRNSAKYGAHSRQALVANETKLEVHLKLEEVPSGLPARNGMHVTAQRCYRLTAWDNLSLDCPNGKLPISRKIRKHLDQDIIGPAGDTRMEGHGIQEMKVCALYLAGGDQTGLHFPPDREAVSSDASSEYMAFLSGSNGDTPRQVDHEVNSLRCFAKEHDSQSMLAYQMILLQPTLLGIVDPDQQLEFALDGSIRCFKSIEHLAAEPAAFGLILGKGDKIDIFEQLARFHVALPYRLMIVTINDQEASVWSRALNEWQTSKVKGWASQVNLLTGEGGIPPIPLPPRRVHIINSKAVFDAVGDSAESNTNTNPKPLVCEVYDKWLRAWKGQELENIGNADTLLPWHLCIGFDRGSETIKQRWLTDTQGEGDDEIGFVSDTLRVRLFGKEGEITTPLTEDVLKLGNQALVLDNHGIGFPLLKRLEESTPEAGVDHVPICRPAVYHQFSGSGQAALFQLLANPPKENIARALLLFSIAESLLMNVMVIDERVAESLLLGDSSGKLNWKVRAAALHATRIFPILDMVFGGEQKALSERIGRAV